MRTHTDVQSLSNQITARTQVGTQPAPPATVETVYFALEIVEAGAECGSDNVPRVLKAGTAYKVCVYASSYPDGGIQQLPLLRTKLQLKLEANSDDITISEPGIELSREDLRDGFVHSFAVSIALGYAGGDLLFVLTAKSSERVDKYHTAAKVTIAVETNNAEDERMFLEQVYITPAVSLPDNVAVLHTRKDRDGNWVLDGYSRRRKQLDKVVLPPPGLSAAWLENMDGKLIPLVWQRFREWSIGSIPELQAWLSNLLALDGDELVLVLVTQNDADFPWELVHVYLAENGEVPLGAHITTVRWMRLNRFQHKLYLELQSDETQVCRGSVTAYLDAKVPGIIYERNALNSIRTTEYGSLQGLYEFIKNVTGTALVFVGCHGEYPSMYREEGDDNEFGRIIEIKLVSSTGEISISALNDLTIIEKPKDRPLFFLNACHSARMISRNGMAGLAVPLLQRAARGYIGAIGHIDSEYAGQLAAELLGAAAAEKDGVMVAQCLRDLRRKAFSLWRQNQTDVKHIYAFFYVYFGNPFLRLQLDKAIAPGAEDNND